jgi:RNA polymerase sigma-70 factor (ECF subfamily)
VGEREIIALLIQRDETGVDALLRHYGPLMRYIIAPILPDPRDREDCLGEVTLRVWEKIEQFDRQRGSWNAWLTALTRNTALNHARGDARHDSVEEIPEDTPSQEPTPEEQVLRQERQAAVEQALRQLTQEEKILFYRKYYYLQSTAQVAAELGLTERAVEGRLYRVKKRLRALLGGDGHE